MPKVCVGIDLGGTFVKFALLDEAMTVRGSSSLATPAGDGPEAVIETMVSGVKGLLSREGLSDEEVVGVGIGSPGPLDIDAGIVIGMPNIPGFDNIPLRDRVADGLGIRAVLENDANVAALGEYLCGSGRGTAVMVMLTLGTGIGSGIVMDGRLVRGAHGIGAEVGHMIVQPGGQPCGCGQQGCLERYSSAAAVARYARNAIENERRSSSLAGVLAEKGDLDAADVNRARSQGDDLAGEAWDRAVHYLAIACVNLCRILDPDLIVFGGGMTKAGDALMQPLREHFSGLHWELAEPRTTLAAASLGNDAGVIGAAGAAWSRFGQSPAGRR